MHVCGVVDSKIRIVSRRGDDPPHTHAHTHPLHTLTDITRRSSRSRDTPPAASPHSQETRTREMRILQDARILDAHPRCAAKMRSQDARIRDAHPRCAHIRDAHLRRHLTTRVTRTPTCKHTAHTRANTHTHTPRTTRMYTWGSSGRAIDAPVAPQHGHARAACTPRAVHSRRRLKLTQPRGSTARTCASHVHQVRMLHLSSLASSARTSDITARSHAHTHVLRLRKFFPVQP